MYIFKTLLFIILSIHRKEPPSVNLPEINSDETSVLCGPGDFKSGEDQEVKLSHILCLHMVLLHCPSWIH